MTTKVNLQSGVSGDLVFTKDRPMITGNFSWSLADVLKRPVIQSNLTNGFTVVEMVPNGTSTTSSLVLNNNSDQQNSSVINIAASTSETFISTIKRTAGVDDTNPANNVPLRFYVCSTNIALQINPSGSVIGGYAIGTSDAQFYANQINCVQSATDSSELAINYSGYQYTTSNYRNFTVYNGKNKAITKINGTTEALSVSDTPFGGTGSTFLEVGTRITPQNSQSAAYTCVLADSGCHILHPAADTTARTFTIPANSSVTYPVGTALTFINQNGAGTITIAITTDTMRLAGAGTVGSRTLAANGMATAIKIAATEWIISGSGLT
jgi:hypothetical protein